MIINWHFLIKSRETVNLGNGAIYNQKKKEETKSRSGHCYDGFGNGLV